MTTTNNTTSTAGNTAYIGDDTGTRRVTTHPDNPTNNQTAEIAQQLENAATTLPPVEDKPSPNWRRDQKLARQLTAAARLVHRGRHTPLDEQLAARIAHIIKVAGNSNQTWYVDHATSTARHLIASLHQWRNHPASIRRTHQPPQ